MVLSQMELVPASAEQLKKISEDINLKEDQLKEDTNTLKEWLLAQPHLPHDIDDRMLASFIVGCKNSVERAKQILDTYLSNRTTVPDFYQSRDPCEPSFRRLAKQILYFVLPKMTPDGYRVSLFCMRSADVPPQDFNLRHSACKVLASFDVRLMEENYWAGDIILINCRHFGFKHLQFAALPLIRKYIHCVNESLPVRYKKIIFFNLSSVVEPVISIAKKALKQKFVQRMITTTEDYQFLYKHFPQDILPDEYGGTAGTIEDLNESWQLKVESYQEWFLKDMTRKVDENKRPEKNNFKQKQLPVFGTDGSFRKLAID